MNRYTALIAITLLSSACGASSPEQDYDQCVQQAAQAPTATGVEAATQNCVERYGREAAALKKEVQLNSADVSHYIYWDGWEFQQGKLPENFQKKNYQTHVIARFDVPVCKVSLPNEMAKDIFPVAGSEMKFDNEISKQMLEACR